MGLKEIVLRVEPQGRAAFEHAVSGDELIIARRSRASRFLTRIFRGARRGSFSEPTAGTWRTSEGGIRRC
jgi:hypothetical protein